MLSLRSIATAVVAILLGLIAIVMVNNYLRASTSKSAPEAAAGEPVVVAAGAINRGLALQPALLKVVKYPTGAVPAGAFHAVNEILTPGAPPRVTLRALIENEPVLPTDLVGTGGRQTMASTISQGMQAISVRVNDVSGVAGFALPGDHVDVLLTRAVVQGMTAQTSWITQVLASDIKVLGVDQVADENTQAPIVSRAVTLEVTHPQAQSIALGQQAGTVSLSLRREGDHTTAAKTVTSVADLGGVAAPPRPRMAAPTKAAIAVIHITRGSTTTDYAMGGR
jgi:pilus assembly protein CpaB